MTAIRKPSGEDISLAEYVADMPAESRVATEYAALVAERSAGREIIGEYLNPICEAFELIQKIERHPPGSGIADADYPGPTKDEVEQYDDELMSAKNALTDAIQVACDAQAEE